MMIKEKIFNTIEQHVKWKPTQETFYDMLLQPDGVTRIKVLEGYAEARVPAGVEESSPRGYSRVYEWDRQNQQYQQIAIMIARYHNILLDEANRKDSI